MKSNREPENEVKQLDRSSKIAKLSPMMDEHGILRVDSRIGDARYPIILPHDHRVAMLLLDWYHVEDTRTPDEDSMHVVSSVQVRSSGTEDGTATNGKINAASSSLSSDSCKKAMRRFIARRGAPQEIYYDNGTNFVGVSRELKREIEGINAKLSSTFTDTYTQWRFNPPSAPHMGGCWERMVRSIKSALVMVPTERKLDDESLVTVFAEAEKMINSRPLTFVSLQTSDQEAITPNHFLLLSSTGVQQPIKQPVSEGESLRSSWDMMQPTLDRIWQKWITDYLPTITRRTKWFQNVRSVKEGELVVIADEKVRNRWLRGRVVRTFPGKDGTVRQVVVTSGGTLRRPVIKLALLDLEPEDDAKAETGAT
ncbi:uncharacterized protein LOC135702593 [Ochlerotatus camptorhynchus]|uniref:uncharacterized protein LOC135702593 n=1 Tax=Ochlerotatus camptorhynchus TaxID=644619 RepID=UPI0031DB9B17